MEQPKAPPNVYADPTGYIRWQQCYGALWEPKLAFDKEHNPMTDLTGWRPIETAPKDGTQILAYAPDRLAEGSYYGIAQWSDSTELPGSVVGWFWPFATRPTHWMPLPEPP